MVDEIKAGPLGTKYTYLGSNHYRVAMPDGEIQMFVTNGSIDDMITRVLTEPEVPPMSRGTPISILRDEVETLKTRLDALEVPTR